MKIKVIRDDLMDRFFKQSIELLKQIDCDHEIREVGYGYQCQKCLLYTGTNSKWNQAIVNFQKAN